MDKFVIRRNKVSSVGPSIHHDVDENIDVSNENIAIDAAAIDNVVIDDVVGDAVDVDLVDDGSEEVVRADARSGKRIRIDDEIIIISDPALRKSINEHEPSVRDDVRRQYVAKGRCQPLSHSFPRGTTSNRCFLKKWFDDWEWLEYSVSKDAAFYFWYYLFKGSTKNAYLNDGFVKAGFRNWKRGLEKFREHVGSVGSAHNDSRVLFFGFKDQRQSVTRCVPSGTLNQKAEYRIRLTFSLDLTRLYLWQEIPFRGHRESKCVLNRGNFMEFHEWCCVRMVEIEKVVRSAPLNF